jgi:tetratricopeptide (TPR) repeat protein
MSRSPLPSRARLAEIERALRRAAKAQPGSAGAHFRLGLLLHETGRLAEAERCYASVLRLDATHADALNNLSIVLEQRGKREDAGALLRRALEAHPTAGALWCNLARLLMEDSRLDEAAAAFERAVALPKAPTAAHLGLGMVRRQQQRLGDAERHFRNALALEPSLGDAQNELGLLLRLAGRVTEAEACFRQAMRAQPGLAAPYLNLGVLLLDGDRLDEAQEAFARALTARPDWADAHYYLGVVYRRRKQNDLAEAALARAIALDGRHTGALETLALVLEDGGRMAEAERMFRRAIDADPAAVEVRVHLGYFLRRACRESEAREVAETTCAQAPDSADAANLRGDLWETDGDFAAACAAYERAVALAPHHPDANFNLGRMRLMLGRFAEGWEGYEWRLKTSRAKQQFFGSVVWDGSPLDGRTIVLHGEQGLGDTLQFCRYVPLVAARGGNVVLAVQPPLTRLLASLPGVLHCQAYGRTLAPFDFLMPLASLPRIFATDFASIPSPGGYLRAPSAALERWGARFAALPPAQRVGLAWAGNPEQAMDRNRSMSPEALLPLLDLQDCRFFNLQVGPHAADLAKLGVGDRLIDLSADLMDFAETAAAMSQLDLVITVDTSVAHLAGALGRPAFVMLTALPDWRWHIEREDCPWYRSLRLFRQTRRGDWAPVVQDVAAALRS